MDPKSCLIGVLVMASACSRDHAAGQGSPARSASAAPEPAVVPASASREGSRAADVVERTAADAGSDCPAFRETAATFVLSEGESRKRVYSVDGYLARRVRMERTIDGEPRSHCIVVAWPPGEENTDGQAVHVASQIDDGWLRGIENTLERVPWPHVEALHRIVIDDRPKEHGIAPFDHAAVDDARDGHTIWLHERMFLEPNHWAHGNYGAYWSYHVDVDGERLDDKPPTHALFSPVLLHELGHLVSYNVINHHAGDPTVPACAVTCADRGGCKELSQDEREQGCVSPYCMPFQFDKTSTENWAEQYRFFYQGSRTRSLLAQASGGCLRVLVAHDGARGGGVAPWARGLPDVKTFHKSLWDSCSGHACKAW